MDLICDHQRCDICDAFAPGALVVALQKEETLQILADPLRHRRDLDLPGDSVDGLVDLSLKAL